MHGNLGFANSIRPFSYHVLYNAFKRVSQGYTASERNNLFHDTAARVYRLNE